MVPSLLISIIALCCLDYFFTPPIFELRLADPLDVVALVAFVTTAFVVTTLMSRMRKSFQEIQALRVQLRLIIDTIPGLIWSALPDGSVGLLNKQIGGELVTSERTIKFHRANIIQKMRAESLADLVRMAQKLGVTGRP